MSDPASTLPAVYHMATRAIGCGISVIPIGADGSKAPTQKWKPFQQRLADENALRFWFRDGERGLAVVTGAVSGGLECLDFDTHDAYDRWAALAEDFGIEDLVVRVTTGYLEKSPRGMHVLYRCDEIGGNVKLAHDDAHALIETRGEGGYVIIAPSSGKVHETGRPYSLLAGGPEAIVRVTPEERRLLLDMARALDERTPMKAADPVTKSEHVEDRSRPGDDWASYHSWSDILEPHGWAVVRTQGEETYWRRPGKTRGISATTNYQGSGYLYIFTTSTGFEASRAYGKFSAYALLEHGGDFKAAARDLRDGGYGSQKKSDAPTVDLSALRKPETRSDLAQRAIAKIRALHAGELAPVPTPWPELTKALGGGFLPGVHIVVGGTGTGKTVIMMKLARYAAEQGHVAAIAPLEMGDEETIVRLSSEACGVPWGAVLRGAISAEQLALVEASIIQTSEMSILIGQLRTSGFAPQDLEALCAEAAKGGHGKTPLIILDFVQLMGADPGERAGDLRMQIRAAAYAARSAAVRHGCAIIMVSSVARQGYGILGGNADALKRAGVEFNSEVGPSLFGAEPDIRHTITGTEGLIGLGKESGELEYASTTVSVLAKLPGVRHGVAWGIAKHRYLRPSWVPFRFESGAYEALDHAEVLAMARLRSAVESTGSEFGGELRDAILSTIEADPWCPYRHIEDTAGAAVRAAGGKVGKTAIKSMVSDLVHSQEIITEKGARNSTLHALRGTENSIAPRPSRDRPATVPRSKNEVEGASVPRSPKAPFRGAWGPGHSATGAIAHNQVLAFVEGHAGCSGRAVEGGLDMPRALVRQTVQALLTAGGLVAVSSGNRRKLYCAATAPLLRRPLLRRDRPATVPRPSRAVTGRRNSDDQE